MKKVYIQPELQFLTVSEDDIILMSTPVSGPYVMGDAELPGDNVLDWNNYFGNK